MIEKLEEIGFFSFNTRRIGPCDKCELILLTFYIPEYRKWLCESCYYSNDDDKMFITYIHDIVVENKMASITLTQEQYQQFQSLLKEKEQRDAFIITSAKGNLTVKSNAFGAKGRVFLQPVRYSNGQTFVRTGGNIPASFHVEATTNKLICVLETVPLTPKDIEYWHLNFTNRPGAVNIMAPTQSPTQPYTPQSQSYVAPPAPAPIQSSTPTETEDNPSEATISKASKYVKAGAYPDLETAIREVLKSKRK